MIQVIAINLTGVWLCMKYELDQMLKQEGGAFALTKGISTTGAIRDRAALIERGGRSQEIGEGLREQA
jgi:hypothetical protein